jgi:hypothetical protein
MRLIEMPPFFYLLVFASREELMMTMRRGDDSLRHNKLAKIGCLLIKSIMFAPWFRY